jgi:chromosome segregation ATPase
MQAGFCRYGRYNPAMLRRLAVVLAFAFVFRVWAGPDDDFITIYNLIQVTDSQNTAGRTADAREGYLKAQQLLRQLQRTHPTWNERVIAYRLRYVADKLASLPESAPAPAPGDTPKAAPKSDELAPTGEVVEQFNTMNAQIARLAAEKQVLEAKLREALTAQPAPVDPKELQSAVEKISQLQSTNKVLLAHLARQEAERRNLVDRVVAEEAQRALNEANRELLAQKTRAAELEQQRATVESQLKKLDSENASLKTQVAALNTDADRGQQVTELTAKLATLQTDLTGLRQQNETLIADRTKLEKQLDDLRARQSEDGILRQKQLETDLALAKAESSRHSAVADELAAQLAKEKGVRVQTETANVELTRRVQALTEQNTALKGIETQLSAERNERQEVEAQLKAAEERFEELRKSLATTANPDAPADPAAAGQLKVLEAEAGRLRDALKDSRARESELATLLGEANGARDRLEREKEHLLARLRDVNTAPAAAQNAQASPTIAALEARLKELEQERDQLSQKLTQATDRSVVELVRLRRTRLGNPRDDAAAFRLRR